MLKNMRKWQQDLIASSKTEALPVMSYPGMTLTGHRVIDVVTKGAAQAACMEALAKRYPSLGAVSMMDLSVEAEAFGAKVQFTDNEAPNLESRVVVSEQDVDALAVPGVGAARTGAYLDALKRAVKSIADRPVFGGAIGPFSLAARLMEVKNVLIETMRRPAFVHATLKKSTAFLLDYIKAIKATGANGVIIAEPVAGLVSPADCDEFSSAYVKRIIEAVQDETFAVILHNCGPAAGKQIASMLSTGACGIHLSATSDMPAAMRKLPADVLGFGNLDPSTVFKMGTPALVREKTLDLLNQVGAYGNFVISSGCDIPPGTSLKNMDAFFDAVAEFNQAREEKRAS